MANQKKVKDVMLDAGEAVRNGTRQASDHGSYCDVLMRERIARGGNTQEVRFQ